MSNDLKIKSLNKIIEDGNEIKESIKNALPLEIGVELKDMLALIKGSYVLELESSIKAVVVPESTSTNLWDIKTLTKVNRRLFKEARFCTYTNKGEYVICVQKVS